MNKYLSNALRIIGTAIFLYLIFIKVNFSSLITHLFSVSLAGLFFSFLIFYFMQLVSTFRWYMLLSIHKLELNFSYLFHANAVSMLSGFIIPTNLGTDVVRFAYAAKKKGIDKIKLTVGTAGDRFFGMFTMAIMLFIALLFSDLISIGYKHLLIVIGVICGIGITYAFFKRRKILVKIGKYLIKIPFGKTINRMFDDISTYKNFDLIKLFFISLFINLIGIFYNYFLLIIVGVSVPFILVFIAYPIKRFITLLPISLGGIGANEITMWTLLSGAGVTMDQIVAYSALTYIILILSSIMYMIPSFISPKELNP